ncbi:prenyltransferase [Streptococcus saliviloxodontae]|uniref:1,4-dihydroxy-2-naphthoate octaprenyltransferase n=1 Tax=Streptococcus saliviloxodontae TaxID=1349416 RepID=A0ABS2PJP8_9STRE|nr:prenyltransferase [Streptococcus saliviloxodontae]MBM7635647.1 1,4-dihydroxy-2-naphthoate octaprenyltransferase [Streptococcus saliviloxodontae]
MTFPVFLELVEIKAKTASILPFLVGLCYSYFMYGTIQPLLALLFFVAMILFNMFVDVWDNYQDYKNAHDNDYLEQTNIIGREGLKLRQLEWLLAAMFISSALIGLLIVYVVGLSLLYLGLFCFAVGVLYSAGPRPLSSLPLGEIFSGVTMGFMICLITVFINTHTVFDWNWYSVMEVFLISLPCTLWISNLMLANNLCDKEEDEKNHRYTLVHYTGVKGGLYLFALTNVLAVMAIPLQYCLGLAPSTVLWSLVMIPFVIKQTRLLWNKQVKAETFSAAVKILALGSTIYVITFALGLMM